MTEVRDILNQREKEYGSFRRISRIAQDLKIAVIEPALNSSSGIADYQREAIEMICSKMARVAEGDNNKIDTWQDIAGYATLVVDILKKEEEERRPGCTIRQHGLDAETLR